MYSVSALTLEEAQADPEKYIRYDTEPYSQMKHMLLSSAITYGILLLSLFGTHLIVCMTQPGGGRNPRRSK
ncbi:unnamed protein product [Echinostoma caproni]|uniref:FXYD domain-containing ion transport regulator n=1 Tax=Echinostoma caproni TaxID=27848 RepID=A0A183B536_9TREM|nr:unnamed protein product [Echinostoma caproni]